MKTRFCWVPVVAGLLVASGPEARADPVFPKESAVGLEPPPGMVPSEKFTGFQKGDRESILLGDLPKAAYAVMSARRDTTASAVKGKAEDFTTTGGLSGFIVRGEQSAYDKIFRKWIVVLQAPEETAMVTVQSPTGTDTLPDAAIEAALKTIAVHGHPRLGPDLGSLWFTVGDLQGFRPTTTVGGAMLVLRDPDETASQTPPAEVVVTGTSALDTVHARRMEVARSIVAHFQQVAMDKPRLETSYDEGDTEIVEIDGPGTMVATKAPIDMSVFIRFRDHDVIVVLAAAVPAARDTYAARFKALALSVKPK